MWSMIVRILSILGIILLCLLVFALVLLLLVLFWPVTYRGGGRAQAGEYRIWFRFRWLFGLVRGAYTYPESGGFRMKALWLTVYDSGGKRQEASDGETQSGKDGFPVTAGKGTAGAGSAGYSAPKTGAEEDRSEPQPSEENRGGPQSSEEDRSEPQPSKEDRKPQPSEELQNEPQRGQGAQDESQSSEEPQRSAAAQELPKDTSQPLSEKLAALREKLLLYLEIVRDDDNRELVKHGMNRLGRIWKSIRPRILRMEAVAGLGEPDLTGYMYGIYWAVKPFLGKKCKVTVTPDFEQRILEGEATLGGQVTAAVLLYHAVRVLLDRRLRQLLDQLKGLQTGAGGNRQNSKEL